MLTYSFENRGSESLYEYLYNQIKNDIIANKLTPDTKLPSKRTLAKHLNVSTVTVETAYQQLIAEGYIYSVAKSGYFVSQVISTQHPELPKPSWNMESSAAASPYFADFANNSTSKDNFPFSTWTKLMRETMSDEADNLMASSPSIGVAKLRNAIADYLFQFRGMSVNPEQIVIGAGTEYLYGLIIQLLGRNKTYALEDPGYQKIPKIYQSNGVSCIPVSMDKYGIDMSELNHTNADVLHISPSHHFPTGIVTPISRRYEILSWAAKTSDRYIIEDDYDSEFRLLGKPIPSLQSIDAIGKVIYMNTFSKSLTSTIRISYMILPQNLMEQYKKTLSFYSCTVSTFEQYTLARFIEKGHFEKHINRMRNYYRTQRDILISFIKKHPLYHKVTIREENSGLHFLLCVNTTYSDLELVERAKENNLHITCISEYFSDKRKATEHVMIINYSGLERDHIEKAVELLYQII